MKIKKYCSCLATLVLLTMSACNGSQKDSKENNVSEVDTTVEGEVMVEPEVTIDEGESSSSVASEERTFDVAEKKITVVYGKTTKQSIIDILGQPTLDIGSRLSYQWDSSDGMGHSTVFNFDDNDILTDAEHRSMKL